MPTTLIGLTSIVGEKNTSAITRKGTFLSRVPDKEQLEAVEVLQHISLRHGRSPSNPHLLTS